MSKTIQPAAKFAVVGLGVMGQNLALNIERNGFPVVVYNRTESKTKAFMKGPAKGKQVTPVYSYPDLIAAMKRPRCIMLMVKAGPAVDAVIKAMRPYLEEGDILIDGGNSFFQDTERRARALREKGLYYLGTGVSGGEEGALWGPSIMPGGHIEAWESVQDVFKAVAARADDGKPCVDYLGPGGAGHYVKMVHNGIEYGVMQLIAEIYDLLHRGAGLSIKELGDLFESWNTDMLSSYLMEITTKIFKTTDPKTKQPILDVILDKAQQKGTGKWTSQNAFDLGVPVHTINAAVASRIISSMKAERLIASGQFVGPKADFKGDQPQLIAAAKEALYAGNIISYAQGFDLMRLASAEYDYRLNMKSIASIWRAGCIIRAELLEDIMRAYDRDEALTNLLLDSTFGEALQTRQGAMRYVITTAIQQGIPIYALSASLTYFDSYRTGRLPANLTQAQRDYFGAHTYRRLDEPGVFHTAWEA